MSKTLKHYHRKKFLYRLLWRNSPRAGAMFSLAWMLMGTMLLPFGLFALLPFLTEPNWPVVTLAVVLFMALQLYGISVCAYGLAGILSDAFKTGWLCSLLGFLGAWLTPLLGLAILPGLIRRKRFVAMLPAVLGSAVFAGVWQVIPGGIELPVAWLFIGTVLYLAALALSLKRGKFSWKFLYPLLIGFAALAYLVGYDAKLRLDVAAERNAISQTLGRSIEVADFWARNDRGFPISGEPLKTLIKESDSSVLPRQAAKTTVEARKLLAEYRSKHAGLIAALERFLDLPPAPIAHERPEGGLLAGMMLPELPTFRQSALFLATVIRADPGAKQQVHRANLGLIKLREWAREDNGLLIAHLVAIAIEHIRLEALGAVLECGEYTDSEFVGLVGDPVDWDRSLLLALGAEATMFQDCVDHVLDIAAAVSDKDLIEIPFPQVVRKRIPLSLQIFFMRDDLFAMRSYRKVFAAIIKGEEPHAFDEAEIRRNGYILTGMLCPALDAVARRNAGITDTRSMALLAGKVVEYRRRCGKLPGSLTFLPETPVAKSVKVPFRLENTAEGFRIVRPVEVKIDSRNDRSAVYPVRLADK